MTGVPPYVLPFSYQDTKEGRLWFFSNCLDEDDFESYISAYWKKVIGDKEPSVYPEPFRIDYIDRQFADDFKTECQKRREATDGEFWDERFIDTFNIKNTPENWQKLEEQAYTWNHEVEEDDESVIEVKTITLWFHSFFDDDAYMNEVFKEFSNEHGIDIKDIDVESWSGQGDG